METILVPTFHGKLPARYSYSKHPHGSSTLAVLFPGRNYPLEAPLMWYSAKAAFQAGCDVLGIEYGYQANRLDLTDDMMETLIDEAAKAVQEQLTHRYNQAVFIGKSLGTVVLTKVLERVSLPVSRQIFLTPLEQVIPGIQSAKSALVVAGDADNAFGPTAVAQIKPWPNVKLTLFEQANHAMETQDLFQSMGILQQTIELCFDFCKEAIVED